MSALLFATSVPWRKRYVEFMNPIIEWMLMVHRVLWFPLNWTLGLDQTSVELPAEFAPALYRGTPPPELSAVKGGRKPRVGAK